MRGWFCEWFVAFFCSQRTALFLAFLEVFCQQKCRRWQRAHEFLLLHANSAANIELLCVAHFASVWSIAQCSVLSCAVCSFFSPHIPAGSMGQHGPVLQLCRFRGGLGPATQAICTLRISRCQIFRCCAKRFDPLRSAWAISCGPILRLSCTPCPSPWT